MAFIDLLSRQAVGSLMFLILSLLLHHPSFLKKFSIVFFNLCAPQDEHNYISALDLSLPSWLTWSHSFGNPQYFENYFGLSNSFKKKEKRVKCEKKAAN